MQVNPLRPTPVSQPPRPAPPTTFGPADKYETRQAEGEWVRPDFGGYVRTCSNLGTALGAYSSHFAVIVGSALLGPMGLGLTGGAALATGVAGASGGLQAQKKGLWGRKILARLGAVAGAVAGGVCWMTRIPLLSTHVETAKNFSYGEMVKHAGDLNHSGRANISQAEAKEFIARLQPGDIILTNDEASTPFATATLLATGKADFTHGIVYQGEGKTIEARMKEGVQEFSLEDVLLSKHHAIAIRPHYTEGQASAVIDAAREQLGQKYDFKFGFNSPGYYCSELVDHSMEKGAPQVEFKHRKILGKEVVFPADLLRTSQADVVAEAGVGHGFFDAFMSKFTPEETGR